MSRSQTLKYLLDGVVGRAMKAVELLDCETPPKKKEKELK
jgi:hypothetical protein